MASTVVTSSSGYTFYTIYCNASVSYPSDTTATVSWSSWVTFGNYYQWGIGLSTYGNGSLRKDLVEACTRTGQTVCSSSGSFSVPRGSTSKTVNVYAKSYGWTVNGYGGVNRTGTCSVNVTIAAAGSPAAPSNASSVRVSDAQNTVSWTATHSTAKPWTAVMVERSVNGGVFEHAAQLSATATSYVDTATAEDCSYRYRVRAYNGVNYSAYSNETETTYNTPAAPRSVTGARTGSGVQIAFSVDNWSNTATGLDLQYSSDKSSWTTATSAEGSPVTSVTYSIGGAYWFRVRNTRGELASAWTETENKVVTITPPAAPTIVSPASGAVLSTESQPIALSWRHNPIDGSVQTAAQVTYTVGSESFTLDVAGSEQSVSLPAVSRGSRVTWAVKTKGADPSYGPESAAGEFTVYDPPTASVTSPEAIVRAVPLLIAVSYGDSDGTLSRIDYSVALDGVEVYSGSSQSASATIPASAFTPLDGNNYTVDVTAVSSTTLSTRASSTFAVEYNRPQAATLEVRERDDTGMSLSIGLEPQAEGEEAAETVIVSRMSGGKTVTLGEYAAGEVETIDQYAPLNVPYTYTVVTVASSGAVNNRVFNALNSSDAWAVLYGGGVAKARYNPTQSESISRPGKSRVSYAGRAYPVSYDGTNIEESRSVGGTVAGLDEIEEFRRLMSSGGRGVYKSLTGDVFHADVDVSIDHRMLSRGFLADVTANVTKIDGEDI